MFSRINDKISVSAQIGTDDVAHAGSIGIGMIINNRPDDESPDQTPGDSIAAAAAAAGIAYVAIPVTHAGFSRNQVTAMQAALAQAGDVPVLAYCRSGTRSTLLWALAMADAGMPPAQIAQAAAQAGYDISPIAPQIQMLAGAAGSSGSE